MVSSLWVRHYPSHHVSIRVYLNTYIIYSVILAAPLWVRSFSLGGIWRVRRLLGSLKRGMAVRHV